MSDALPLPPRPNLDQVQETRAGIPARVHVWRRRRHPRLGRTMGGSACAPARARDRPGKKSTRDEVGRGAGRTAMAQHPEVERHGPVHPGRRASLRGALPRFQELAEVHRTLGGAHARRLAGVEVRTGGRRDRQRRPGDALEADRGESWVGTGAFDAGTSLDAASLHFRERSIEDFRQKTPKDIIAIARLLLDAAGADVNAEWRHTAADPQRWD